MAKKLLALGFVAAARKRDGLLFRQGRIAFVINSQESGPAAEFRRLHGASAFGMGFNMASAEKARQEALVRGARGAGAAESLFPETGVIEGDRKSTRLNSSH